MRLLTTSSCVARPRTPFFLPETATEIELEAEIGIENVVGIEAATEIESPGVEVETEMAIELPRPPAPPISRVSQTVPIALFVVCS